MVIMQKYDIAIIGGGVLGTTISYWLSTLYDLKICLMKKNMMLRYILALVTVA